MVRIEKTHAFDIVKVVDSRVAACLLHSTSRRAARRRRATMRECAGQSSLSAAEVAARARTECLYLALRSIGDSLEIVVAAAAEGSRPRREICPEFRLRVQARG